MFLRNMRSAKVQPFSLSANFSVSFLHFLNLDGIADGLADVKKTGISIDIPVFCGEKRFNKLCSLSELTHCAVSASMPGFVWCSASRFWPMPTLIWPMPTLLQIAAWPLFCCCLILLSCSSSEWPKRFSLSFSFP